MKKAIILNVFFLFFGIGHSQTNINQELKKELDLILKSDQLLREYSDSEITPTRKAEILKETGFSKEELDKNLWKIVNKQDSINLVKVENIVSKFGYPGKTLVGEPTNEAVWYVIQHSKKIPQYFSLIQKAGQENEISYTKVAKMEDRLLMYEGKEQIYGTQGAGRRIINESGKEEFFNFIWPIKDPKKVNELRKNAGFSETVEEYAKSLDIDYKVFTLEDYKKLKIVEFNKH